MKKNKLKFESYQYAFKLLNFAVTFKDLPHCIAAIAVAESLIADRCLSFLNYKDKALILGNKGKFIPTTILITNCQKHFNVLPIEIKRRKSKQFKSKDLFKETILWLKKRNYILHSFAKSFPSTPTMNILEFEHLAIETAQDGLKYAALIKKWHQTEVRKNKK